MITIKQLDNAALIEDACALLYKVYHEEVVWKFSPDNPSQIRVEVRNNRNLLVDRFTDTAVWFGAFDDSQIVGCARLTFVDENNRLELESYKNSRVIQKYLPTDKSRCAELTRAAVLPSHRARGIIRDIFLAIFQYCEDHQYSVCATPNHGYIVKLLKEINWPLKMQTAFKYEEQDPTPVDFNFANYDKSEVKNVILNLASYKTGVNPNNARILDALEIVAPILPTPVYWHDAKGVVLGINANCLKAIGATKDIIGKNPCEFYPKEVAENILKHNEQVMKTGEILSQDEPMKDIVTGKTKIFRSTKAPLYNDEGEIIGIIGSSIEITNERQAEILKTEFIQNMQHDLRTPTSGLMSMLEIFALKETDPERRETLFLMHDAAKKVHEICNEIIDFKNISHHNDTVVIKKLSIEHIVRGVIELSRPAAVTRNLSLDFEIDPKIPIVLKSDPKRISRLLINLVGNAIKFTKAGAVSLRAKLMKIQDKEVIVQFEIQDTGIGIPVDKRDMIYEQFTRIAPSNEGYYKGSGLGLNIVKCYIDDLDGEIDLHSELGKGTTFYVTLPFKKPLVDEIYDEEPINPQGVEKPLIKSLPAHSAPMTHDDNVATLKLLLIEDDPLARMAALNTLTVAKAQITTAENVVRALEHLETTKFDLVISDLGLPDGTGNDIVAAVKKNSKALNYNTPFLALTAHSNPEKKTAAEHAGFLLVMTKPLAKERVIAIVDAYVHKKAVALSDNVASPNDIEVLSVIDLELGEELTSHTPGLAMELLGMLADELPKDVLLVQRAYSKNDIQALRELFHKMKGGFCYCGVPRLQNALTLIHDAVKKVSQVNEIFSLFEQLYREINLFLDAYQQLDNK